MIFKRIKNCYKQTLFTKIEIKIKNNSIYKMDIAEQIAYIKRLPVPKSLIEQILNTETSFNSYNIDKIEENTKPEKTKKRKVDTFEHYDFKEV